jgi:hypothetical protein
MKFERAMNFKGTKGEWIFKKGLSKHIAYTVISDITNPGVIIADLYPKADNSQEANAKLIAAAPDLLEACQKFVDKCDTGRARSVESYSQMKAAIEKALTD